MAVKPTRRSADRDEAKSTKSTSAAELAGALHEVSNSLTVVLGWLGEARAKLPPGQAREAVEVAYTHARLGHSVARSAIGAPVSGSGDVRSACSLARDAVLAVRQEAQRRGVKVYATDPLEDALLCDAEAALQILLNLLLNALSFSPEASTVTLELSNRGPSIVFAVQDEGPGVPEEMRETIFLGGESRRAGGAGLGLSYCAGLAATSEGHLSLAESARGARFELAWPIGEAPSTTIQRVVSPGTLRGMRVLVLEDDPSVTCLLELGLSTQGVDLVSVSNVGELRRAIANGHYHAALLDFSPIEDDPSAVFKMLHAQQPHLPILLMSGSSMASDVDRAVSGWVRKPFELSEIYEALRTVPESR